MKRRGKEFFRRFSRVPGIHCHDALCVCHDACDPAKVTA